MSMSPRARKRRIIAPVAVSGYRVGNLEYTSGDETRILELLTRRSARGLAYASRMDIRRETSLAEDNVKHAVKRLFAKGLIKAFEARDYGGKGANYQVYALAPLDKEASYAGEATKARWGIPAVANERPA